jgi:hypothetical protein
MQRRIFITGLVITTLGLPAPSIGWELVPPNEERKGLPLEKFRFLGASTTSRCPLPIRWGASPSALSS